MIVYHKGVKMIDLVQSLIILVLVLQVVRLSFKIRDLENKQ